MSFASRQFIIAIQVVINQPREDLVMPHYVYIFLFYEDTKLSTLRKAIIAS